VYEHEKRGDEPYSMSKGVFSRSEAGFSALSADESRPAKLRKREGDGIVGLQGLKSSWEASTRSFHWICRKGASNQEEQRRGRESASPGPALSFPLNSLCRHRERRTYQSLSKSQGKRTLVGRDSRGKLTRKRDALQSGSGPKNRRTKTIEYRGRLQKISR